MLAKFFRSKVLFALLALTIFAGGARLAFAESEGHAAPHSTTEAHAEDAAHGASTNGDHGDEKGHGETAGPRPVFEAAHATWFNILARNIFATDAEKKHMEHEEHAVAGLKERAARGEKLSEEDAKHLKTGVHYVAKYDWLLYTPLLWLLLAAFWVGAARKAKIRPEGKASSAANTAEWLIESFQDYLISVMGNDLARKYTPLLASFFFTILVSNWLGLVPGMMAASAQPAVPIALAVVAFFAVHIIAIKEGGFKTWFMHFVGEPVWLAPLTFPLHLVGEIIKPLSLSFRLLCNVFGEEAVVVTLAGLSVALLPIWLPIPFQLPMLFLGTFFGFLQALVFSTLLAIYISIFASHHGDDHHAEHAHDHNGNEHIVGHPTQLTVGS
jgi:F-type H+-transporting ATPase subunit a